eukprot:gi/632978109/ref/XP_007905722.1/ PREDICTED: tumor necrosis factor receptor superfamily member 11B [Callorhinchus milii]
MGSVSLASLQRHSGPVYSSHEPLYQHWDEGAARYYKCKQCPPGTHVKSHCNAERMTECSACPEAHYTEYWNYLDECQYCNVFCKEYQYIKHECNTTHNRVCECIKGHHLEFEFCIKHKKCSPGFGLKKLGTPYADTECMRCPKGFFSAIWSAKHPCKKHSNCTAIGLKLAFRGDAFQDSICKPCENKNALDSECLDPPIYNNITLCDEAVFTFITRQKLTSQQLRKLLENLPGKKMNVEHLDWSRRTNMIKIHLLHLLKQWKIENDGADTVKSLLYGLELANIHSVYQKLLRRLHINMPIENTVN